MATNGMFPARSPWFVGPASVSSTVPKVKIDTEEVYLESARVAEPKDSGLSPAVSLWNDGHGRATDKAAHQCATQAAGGIRSVGAGDAIKPDAAWTEGELRALGQRQSQPIRRIGYSLGILFATALTIGLREPVVLLVAMAAAITLHELGHWLTMKLSGDVDRSVFILPYLGLASTGDPVKSATLRRALVLFMGSTPGIVVGFLIMAIPGWASNLYLFSLVEALLLINTLNLLPPLPLDGGRLFNDFGSSRSVPAAVLFVSFGPTLLFLLGLLLRAYVLSAVAVVAIVLALPHVKLVQSSVKLKGSGNRSDNEEADSLSDAQIQRYVSELRSRFGRMGDSVLAVRVMQLHNLLMSKRSSRPMQFVMSMATGLVMLGGAAGLVLCSHSYRISDPVQNGRRVTEWVRLLDGEDHKLRETAQEVLTCAFDSEKPFLAIATLRSIGRLGPEGKGALPFVLLALSGTGGEVQMTAAEVAGRIGPDAASAVPHLVAVLDSPNWELRATAATALGRIGPAAISGLNRMVNLVRDPDPFVRAAAAQGVARLGPEAATEIQSLTDALEAEEDEWVRDELRSTIAILTPKTE